MSGKTSIILSILPLVFLTLIVFRFSLDLPYWDQWEFVPLLQKSYQGNLLFNDFWVPHNEHRPVFPRLIMLGLVRMTNWNIRYELVLNILLAIGIYTLLLKAGGARSGSPKSGVPLVGDFGAVERQDPQIKILLSIVVFSLTQWENWVWGWQIQVFLNVFAICLGFYFLTKSYNNKIYFITSILCGIIATFSFANGLLFWPIGFFILISLARSHLARLIWIVISIIIYVIYLPGLSTQFDTFSIINNILLYLSYVTAYLGAPVFGLQPLVASLFGVLGLVIFIASFVISSDPEYSGESRDLTKRSLNLKFFFSLGLYAILSAFFTGLGRYNLGSLQAISSRYITFGSLLWLSNIVFLFLKGEALKASPLRTFRGIAIIIIIFLITTTSLYRIKTVIKRYNDLSTAQTVLITGTSDILLEKLYYNEGVVKERSEFLRSFNLSLFRK